MARLLQGCYYLRAHVTMPIVVGLFSVRILLQGNPANLIPPQEMRFLCVRELTQNRQETVFRLAEALYYIVKVAKMTHVL